MKKLFRYFIALSLVFVLAFSLIACMPESNKSTATPPDTSIDTPAEDNNNNGGNTEENTDEDAKNEADTADFDAVKQLGFSGDYSVFQSILDSDLAFALPSKNGAISIQEREDSPYKSQFHSDYKYIFEARPDDGYYFERWEAYDSKGKELNTDQYRYIDGVQHYFQRNVIGDYKYVNYSNTPIRFIRAVFTNDGEKLVDTPAVPFEEYGEADGLTISHLPDKIVKGTQLYQIARPKAGYYITEWSTFYASKTEETLPGTGIIIGGNSVRNSLDIFDLDGLIFEYDESCVITGTNSSFGIPSTFYIKTRKASEVSPVYLHYSHLRANNMDGTGGYYFPKPQNLFNPSVMFVDRKKPLYLEPRSQYMGNAFYGWYDWDGNLLTRNYVYTDLNFDEDVLHLSIRFASFSESLYQGFSEHTDYFRFNPIKNGTEWEVIYNYDNSEFIDVLEIPATYKGLPVTRIADRGFAKFWLRNPINLDQWWFEQYHPQIGRLIVPSTILEVGDYAFATVHENVSTDSLTTIAEDTDGDNWTDTYTDITYTVEFKSINTRVTPFTFAQSGHKFVSIWGQMEQVLNTLLHEHIDGVYALKLNFIDDAPYGSSGFYSLADPYTINLSNDLLEEGNGKLYFALLHEFRHFMQFVAVGAIDGASLKTDMGALYTGLVQDNLDNYISAEQSYNDYNSQFVEQDANAFAYSYFGYRIKYTSIVKSAY